LAQGQHSTLGDQGRIRTARRMVKRLSSAAAASEEAKAYSVRYVEPPSAARTKLADFSNILLWIKMRGTVPCSYSLCLIQYLSLGVGLIVLIKGKLNGLFQNFGFP